VVGQLDEHLATVGGVRDAADRPRPLQPVDELGHRGRRDVQPPAQLAGRAGTLHEQVRQGHHLDGADPELLAGHPQPVPLAGEHDLADGARQLVVVPHGREATK
jgi:hypothetical protein